MRACSYASPQKRAMLWKRYYLATYHIEKELLKRRADIEDEIEQLNYCLVLPCISEQVRDSIIARLEELKDSPLMAAYSTKIDRVEGEELLIRGRFSSKDDVSSEISFVGKYEKDNIYWRAIQVTVVRRADMNERVPYTEPSIGLLDSPIVFDKDSLAHFQNCPVPPPLRTKICSRAQNVTIKSPTKGCLVGVPQHIPQPRLREGGMKWINLKRRWTNVSDSYRELPLTYPRNFKSSFTDSAISSKSAQRSRRGPYQSYSDFTAISLKANTSKHSTSSFFCSFLSHSENVRNKNSLKGEIN